MKITLKRPLADFLICLLWSFILLPIILMDITGVLRIILGLPFLLFIPGYLLSLVIFPLKKTKTGIDTIERLALSFALSLAIIPLIGLVLNYTPWGLQIIPILYFLMAFIIGIWAIAIYQFYHMPSRERIITTYNLYIPKLGKNLDSVITIILVASIIIAPVSVTYVLLTPRTGITFTEFYLLNSDGIIGDYQENLAVGENISVIIGIANHEQKKIDYTVEIWLLNQSVIYNKTTFENKTICNDMWYINKINVTLDHVQADIEKPWQSQWEYSLTFNITRAGNFKLLFLLFTTTTDEYNVTKDYQNITEQKINDAYRATNLWLNVTNLPRIYDVSTNPSSTLQDSFVNISCLVFDFDGIEEVFLNVTNPYGAYENFSITKNNSGLKYYCNQTYAIAGRYWYTIWAEDRTGSRSSKMNNRFFVTDIPIVSNIESFPKSAFEGSFVNISCLVLDSDGIKEVFLNITNPYGGHENFSITENNSGLEYYCNQTYTVVGNYSYFIWINDRAGNTNTSEIKHFFINYIII